MANTKLKFPCFDMYGYTKTRQALLCCVVSALAACGGGSGDSDAPAPSGGSATASSHVIGGTVTGLASDAQVTLQDNGGDSLTIGQNGAFQFATRVPSGAIYAVTVLTQPSGQTCSVAGQSGQGAGVTADVTGVSIACSTNAYTIGGVVSGLSEGEQVTLQNNGADDLVLSVNAPFTFATPVAFDGSYSVIVTNQPSGKSCSATGQSSQGSGVSANVTNVDITCATDAYTIGGTVTGLAAGTQLTVQDNGSDSLVLTGNGEFTFGTPIAYGGGYSVVVKTQPVGQTCSANAQSAQGAAVLGNVGNVSIVCSSNAYAVGGTVAGLVAGAQVTLQNNGGDALTLAGNGSYQFATPGARGGGYDVTVAAQPAGQYCVVSQGTGSNLSAPVSNANVVCQSPANVALTLPGGTTAMAATVAATATLSNPNDSAMSGLNFGLALPPGFSASVPSGSVCGGGVLASGGQVNFTSGQLAAKTSCDIALTLTTPTLALPAPYSAAFAWNGLSGVAGSGAQPSLSFGATTPTHATSLYGMTPGSYTNFYLPVTSGTPAYVLDITVNTDPGPASDVYWAFQVNALNGYVGLQSTTLPASNGYSSGKLFLFSLWGTNLQATPGALPGQPRALCNVSATMADGSPGAGCRTQYDWQIAHTYRFTVSALGDYQYKVNVTDITPGIASPVSFDIGTIRQPASGSPSTIPKVDTDITEFEEYFDWNDNRTTCLSVPFTSVTLTASYTRGDGTSQLLVPYTQTGGTGACKSTITVDSSANTAQQFGGQGQSSQGLFRAGTAGCLSAVQGLTDGPIPGGNAASLSTCPTAQTVAAASGQSFRSSLWVYAQDHSVQSYDNYCLTAPVGAISGSQVSVQSCVAGALNQQWTSTASPGAQTLRSPLSGLCAIPKFNSAAPSNTLLLGNCSSAAATVWSMPGRSFQY